MGYNFTFSDGKVITKTEANTEGVQYYQITDYTKATPITAKFTKYPASQIEKFVFKGDYGLVQVHGLDEKTYVTMIDMQGNELITPIKDMDLYNFILAPNGYAYYKTRNGNEYEYYIIDKNNNVTIPNISGYYEISFDSSNDIGKLSYYLVRHNIGDHYRKPNGDVPFENITVK